MVGESVSRFSMKVHHLEDGRPRLWIPVFDSSGCIAVNVGWVQMVLEHDQLHFFGPYGFYGASVVGVPEGKYVITKVFGGLYARKVGQ